MPLGNLTSQFFANIYLNELDYFVKHKLRAKHYIRYVDDFVILHESKKQLRKWKNGISYFLKSDLNLELHPDKSKIISLSKPINFVGFRVFYHNKLLKKFNQRNIQRKLNNSYELFLNNKLSYDKIYKIMQGAFAHMKHADTYNLRNKLIKQMEEHFPNELSEIETNRYLKILKS